MCPPPWSALRDWMSLSRTSCNNTMHYYPLPLVPPPQRRCFFASSSLLSCIPTEAICGYSSPISTLLRVSLSFILVSLLAANVVALSFLPTSLAAHILLGEKFLRFLNGIIWSIILDFFGWSNFFSLFHSWGSVSARFVLLGPLFDEYLTHHLSTNAHGILSLRLRRRVTTAEVFIPSVASTETRRLRFLQQLVLLVLVTNTHF